MKIVILGAGALGTVLGAHLARAGEDVTLIARGQRAAYLQAHGATLTGMVEVRGMDVSHGACSIDPFGELQDSPRPADGIHHGGDTA